MKVQEVIDKLTELTIEDVRVRDYDFAVYEFGDGEHTIDFLNTEHVSIIAYGDSKTVWIK